MAKGQPGNVPRRDRPGVLPGSGKAGHRPHLQEKAQALR